MKEKFPELYSCTVDKDVLVSSVLETNLNGDGSSWNVRFLWDFHDWELDLVTSFLDFIYSHLPKGVGPDTWSWSLQGSGKFEVRSFCKALSGITTDPFPWKSIWCMKALKRVFFFVWMAAWGRILTHDNLRKRGVCLVSWCCMCRCNGETVAHLLLHCDTVFGLWGNLLATFGIH